jgi:hypothetical protein
LVIDPNRRTTAGCGSTEFHQKCFLMNAVYPRVIIASS